jgi:putative SOS response-associated peptidase YedK
MQTGRSTSATEYGIVPVAATPAAGCRSGVATTRRLVHAPDSALAQTALSVGVIRASRLIPAWAKDEKIGYSTINARAETVADKPAFRSAFKSRRCLVVADGYYEWIITGGPKSKPTKQPYRIHRPDDRPFGIAGLWEHWEHDGRTIESCTVIVTSANAKLAGIHDRMPCIIPHDEYGLWLDPEFQGRDKLLSLLQPSPDAMFESYAVSPAVGNVKNQGAELLEPIDAN